MAQPISAPFFVQKPHIHFLAQTCLQHNFTTTNLSNNRTLVKSIYKNRKEEIKERGDKMWNLLPEMKEEYINGDDKGITT